MKVGITYDLAETYLGQGLSAEDVAELDRPDTITGIQDAVASFGHQVEPIGNLHELAARLVDGQRWDLVFNIAEGLYGAARESQVPALLDAYRIPYTFSDPLVLGLALHKGLAKMVVRDAGVRTPEYAVVERLEDLASVRLSAPVFAKPVAEGTSKGITPASVVRDLADLPATCAMLLERYRQPVLLETYLPGREFTVGIVGTGARAEVLGALEVELLADAEAGVYSFKNKKEFEGKVAYHLADPRRDPEVAEAERVALAAWRALGCRDGGRVDVRSDAQGRPSFIEANPLAGLNPEISDLAILVDKLGLGYRALIGRILESAAERVG
jgi:D-alanine-D-alanine ligase